MAASLDFMAKVLKKLSLGHLTDRFQTEKITRDTICMLSAHEINGLGISNKVDMMNLRLECCTYGGHKPKRKPGECGAPEFDISKSVLEGHLEEGFIIKDISSMLSASERTVYRRMEK